jgi:hypothetical protein
MSNDHIRLSQVISTFGPGAMVDLPNHSVIIAGLERWHDETTSKVIVEPRLSERLERDFAANGLIADGDRILLKTPPRLIEKDNVKPGVEAFVFPEWFVTTRVEHTGRDGVQRRRLVHWRSLDTVKSKRVFRGDDGKAVDVTPLRFVGGCKKGHLQDLPWTWLVHGGPTACKEGMWLEERGTSASPEDTSIVCDCGGRFNLRDAFAPKRLGKCGGHRPWLKTFEGRNSDEACAEDLRFLTRTATNTYFPQVVSVISLPQGQSELERLLALPEHAELLVNVKTLDLLRTLLAAIPKLQAFAAFSAEQVFAALCRPTAEGSTVSLGFHGPEFDTFASGDERIGDPSPGSTLYAETLPLEKWHDADVELDLSLIKNVVAVHHLREVVCLYGFTRFDAPPAQFDDGLEEVRLSVEGARLSQTTSWLPAIEQFGEGIFIEIDPSRVADWRSKTQVDLRQAKLLIGFNAWKIKTGYVGDFPGLEYVLVHSLSHALMAEIALECGYPSSALKERVYALRSDRSGPFTRLGLLIYSASAGAQGTLGGIVAQSRRFSSLLKSALARLEFCSNDPICADHEPGQKDDDRRLLGAACPSCLLVPETSCEKQNQFLDRAVLVETLARDNSGAFIV